MKNGGGKRSVRVRERGNHGELCVCERERIYGEQYTCKEGMESSLCEKGETMGSMV